MAQVGSYELFSHMAAQPSCLNPRPWEGLGKVPRLRSKPTKFSARAWRLTSPGESLLTLTEIEAELFNLLVKEYYSYETK